MPEDFVGSDHVNGLKGASKALRKHADAFLKKDPECEAAVEFAAELDAVDKNIDVIEPGKSKLTDKAFTKPRDRLTRLAKEAKAVKKLVEAKDSGGGGWEVSIHKDVAKWCKDHQEKPLLDGIVKEIKKYGDSARGLRPIKKGLYDIKCKKSSDDRIVGTSTGDAIKFEAIYSHAKGGGKQLVAGKKVSAYG